MLRAATNDAELVTLEHAGFGVSHDALGAALCESWGLGAAAVASVRHHVQVQQTRVLPEAQAKRSICALSALAHTLMAAPEQIDEAVTAIAPQADLELTLVQRAVRQALEQLQAAASNGRA